MGRISVGWHHPADGNAGTAAACEPDINGLAFFGSSVCIGLNMRPSEWGWLQRSRKTCRIKAKDHFRGVEVLTDLILLVTELKHK